MSTRHAAKSIPDRLGAAVGGRGTLDLVGGSRTAPAKIGRKLGAAQGLRAAGAKRECGCWCEFSCRCSARRWTSGRRARNLPQRWKGSHSGGAWPHGGWAAVSSPAGGCACGGKRHRGAPDDVDREFPLHRQERVVAAVEQAIQAAGRHFAQRDVHRGEPGRGILGGLRVVVAQHRDLLGYREARLLEIATARPPPSRRWRRTAP